MTRCSFENVATLGHHFMGITVSEGGRTFVCFPQRTDGGQVAVAELTGGGALRPYPNEEWNAWQAANQDEISPCDHWVCVSSVLADERGNLWVLNSAAAGPGAVVPGGPKLVQIDLASDQVVRAIALEEPTAPRPSHLNDVRVTPDGRHAYISESGVGGALLIVDLDRGAVLGGC